MMKKICILIVCLFLGFPVSSHAFSLFGVEFWTRADLDADSDGIIDAAKLPEGEAYTMGEECDFYGTILNPQGVYDNNSINHAVSIVVNTPAAFTITGLYISCNIDPATEPTLTFKHKSAGYGFGSATTIAAVTTTGGVASITSGIDDPTIPANTKMFITLSDPDDALLEIAWQIKGVFD